ncbi:MAG: TIGR00300 family protein [Chloroflexi bacterium]|nr:TIGR00300 family protein [Chloroflexota bacterium]
MPTEIVEIRGHLIDSLILPRVIDQIIDLGGRFRILQIDIGRQREDLSYARLEVEGEDQAALDAIQTGIKQQGAEITDEGDVELAPAPADGVFPEGFYVTTNLPTRVRVEGKWLQVENPRMDCAIRVDPAGGQVRTVRFPESRRGDLFVTGHTGVRVAAAERSLSRNIFEFMGSSVSSEKPKSAIIADIAEEMVKTKARDEEILLVLGPVVVHTGAAPHIVRLIELGYVDKLFSGNALAVHDMEQAIFGTSLGISLEEGLPTERGHQNHMRVVNAVRRVGGIRPAVESGLLAGGIMHACVKHGVDFLLAGSVRDDGPIPDVITDVVEAQLEMARRVRDVGLALMIGTMLHSVATANLLPARVKVVCVDINPAVVTKLLDRGSFQTIGLVSDAEPFLHELVAQLEEKAAL